jgi:hypothetical protein
VFDTILEETFFDMYLSNHCIPNNDELAHKKSPAEIIFLIVTMITSVLFICID